MRAKKEEKHIICILRWLYKHWKWSYHSSKDRENCTGLRGGLDFGPLPITLLEATDKFIYILSEVQLNIF